MYTLLALLLGPPEVDAYHVEASQGQTKRWEISNVTICWAKMSIVLILHQANIFLKNLSKKLAHFCVYGINKQLFNV